MVVKRGEIWWTLTPGSSYVVERFVRPMLIIQTDPFNKSNIPTVSTVVISSDMRLVDAPGNVRLSKQQSGLECDSVVDVSRIVTLDRALLSDLITTLPPAKQRQVDEGLRLILGL